MKQTQKLTRTTAFTLAESGQKRHVIAPNEHHDMSLRSGTVGCCPQPNTCAISQRGNLTNLNGRRSRKPRRADFRTDVIRIASGLSRLAQGAIGETPRAWRKYKTGTSVARDEQQSTEMLNFRCCCERCRLMRGAEGSVRPGNDMKVGKAAFTLAETLIALAVIGIVAALTIPGIVKNYNEHAWSTAQDVFSRKLDVALKEMNTEGTLTGYSTTEDFVNELKKNIKITKICTGSQITNCFADKVVWNADEEPVEVSTENIKHNSMHGDDWAETIGIQFANGINALIGYNKNCASDPYNNQYSPSASCIGIIYDVSGFKKPNSNGKDISSNGKLTLGCAFKFSYGGETVCFTKVLAPGEYNPFPMTINGTKTYCSDVKGDLGISGCYFGETVTSLSDYWAGAAYACGGVKKMASEDQLSLLAKYLYNTDSLSTTQGSLTMREDRLGPFSAFYTTNTGRWSSNYDYENCFYVWAGSESDYSSAYGRNFYYSNTSVSKYYGRGATARFAACVE